MKKNIQKQFKSYAIITLGNIVLAIAVACVIIPNKILTGGLSGIAVALNPIFHIREDILIYFLQALLFILGAIFLGKDFIVKTLYSTILYPLLLGLITSTGYTFQLESQLVASIFGGLLIGISIALVFSEGASTGGVDVLVLIGTKYTPLPLSQWVLIIDGVVVLIGVLTFGLESSLIGLLSVYASTLAMDKVLTIGANDSLSLHIISDHYLEIIKEIHTTFDRGSTILQGKGSYSGNDKPVVFVVVDKAQYPHLQRSIREIDPNSFIIVNETKEVHGEGFTKN